MCPIFHHIAHEEAKVQVISHLRILLCPFPMLPLAGDVSQMMMATVLGDAAYLYGASLQKVTRDSLTSGLDGC